MIVTDILLDGLFAALGQLTAKAGRKFVYGYWPDYDSAAHEHGCRSPQALAAVDAFAAAAARAMGRPVGPGLDPPLARVRHGGHGHADDSERGGTREEPRQQRRPLEQ